MAEKAKTGNDDRSDKKNPNNDQHQKANDNTSNQKNPNHDASKGK